MPLKIVVILALLMHFGLPCRQAECTRAVVCGVEATAAAEGGCCGAEAPADAPCPLLAACPEEAEGEGCPPCCMPCPLEAPAAPTAPDRDDQRGPIERDAGSGGALTLPPVAPLARSLFETDGDTRCPRVIPTGLRRAMLCSWTT